MDKPVEQYEVLDEQGHKIGKTLDRITVHKQGLWHEVVNVWVINSRGELLMQLRAPDVELSPNVWDVTVGSHLRPGEEPVQGAARALNTELKLNTVPDELKHLFNIQCANPMPNGTTHKVLGHVFLMQHDVDISALKPDPKKITKLAWVSLQTLMLEVGATGTKAKYFPRANNYYPQLFEAFQAWM
jgi:isopentenyldiphosphate isomerase